jgi:hypothetical protein
MAKFEHLLSTVSGDIPATLTRGQLAVNIPDQLVYAPTPDGLVSVISSGVPGVANASTLLGVHVPTQFEMVAQFAPGYTQAQIASKFVIGATTVTLQTVPIFALGILMYTPVLTLPIAASGAYMLSIDLVARTCVLSSLSGTLLPSSGTFNPINNTFSMVFYSDSTILPWFYVPAYQGIPNGTVGSNPGDCLWYRISPVQTFGAIPVSNGFAGAAAASYWGTFP